MVRNGLIKLLEPYKEFIVVGEAGDGLGPVEARPRGELGQVPAHERLVGPHGRTEQIERISEETR